MEIFKQLKELGYKHYIDLTIEELDNLPINNIERRIECSLVIDWFREKHGIEISITYFRLEFRLRNKILKYTSSICNTNTELSEESDEYWEEHGMIEFESDSYQEAREQAILKTIELCKK